VNSAISISTIGVGIGTDTPTCLLDVVRYTTGSVNNNYQFRILNSADGLYPYSVLLLEHNNRTGVGNAGGATIVIKDGFANVVRAGIGFDYFNSGSYTNGGGTLRLSNDGQGNLILATGGVDAVRVFKDQGVQIGGISTNLSSTARLLVKGSGTTSATIALLVQNSAGTTAFSIKDNGITNASYIEGGTCWFNNVNSNGIVKFGSSMSVGFNTDPIATAQIKGSGSTSATSSLLVQNSSGTTAFQVKDNLQASFGDGFTGDGLRIEPSGNSAIVFRQGSDRVILQRENSDRLLIRARGHNNYLGEGISTDGYNTYHWKMEGEFVAPVTMDTTKYVKVFINGVAYKLAVCV
jgi:hypothetical protein